MVVDEGHRLKNMDCRLIRELRLYKTVHRSICSLHFIKTLVSVIPQIE